MSTIQITCTGYTIFADWYEGTDKNKLLLVLPGYTSTRANQKDFASAVVKRTGMSVLVIEYSGHGDSPFELKDTRPAQHFLEVVCAFDWLKNQYPNAGISVAGSSYGGFLGTQLTKYRTFEKLVLRAPAIYKPGDFYNTWASRLLDEEKYHIESQMYRQDTEALAKHPLLARASAFSGKTLVVVHENDELVPRQTTDAYINAFGAESFIATGFSHGVRQSPVSEEQIEAYQDRIADWLGK